MQKKCFKCDVTKELNEYYKHPGMSDGHLNKCKECTKKDSQKREQILRQYPGWVQKERKRGREKYYRLNYKEMKPSGQQKKISQSRYIRKYPEKRKATNMSQHIKRKKGYQIHHWSYNTEHYKDVLQLPLCEHVKAHRYMIYDQERMMYRTVEGILLDTKKSHTKYIDSLKNKD